MKSGGALIFGLLNGRFPDPRILRESGHEHFAGSVVGAVIDLEGNVTEIYGGKITEGRGLGRRCTCICPGRTRAHVMSPVAILLRKSMDQDESPASGIGLPAVVALRANRYYLAMRLSGKARHVLLALRAEMMLYLQREEADTQFCARCLLPMPEGEFEAYDFCPWCAHSINGLPPRLDESRKIIENQWDELIEIQCGECGCEYGQPARYPYKFCVVCGAPFAAHDEIVIVLPWLA